MYVLSIVVCPFVLFRLAIVWSVLLGYTDSDYPFGIFKLFLLSSKVFTNTNISDLFLILIDLGMVHRYIHIYIQNDLDIIDEFTAVSVGFIIIILFKR
jgi:hypothetical protein